jgi:hypothetical protein
MSGAPLLLVAAPLALTYWVLVVAVAVIVFLLGVVVVRDRPPSASQAAALLRGRWSRPSAIPTSRCAGPP